MSSQKNTRNQTSGGDATEWSTFPALETIDVNNYNISNVSNIGLQKINNATYPSTLGTTGQVLTISSTANSLYWANVSGGSASDWATYPAIQDVDMSGYFILNIDTLSAGTDIYIGETSISNTLINLSTEISNLSSAITTLSGTVSNLSGYVYPQISSISSAITTLSGTVSNLSSAISTLSGTVSNLSGYVYPQISNISSAISTLSGTVSNLSGYVYSISGAQFWSIFPAIQNVNMSGYVISNISSAFISNNVTVSGITTLSAGIVRNALNVSGTATLSEVIVQNLLTVGNNISGVTEINSVDVNINLGNSIVAIGEGSTLGNTGTNVVAFGRDAARNNTAATVVAIGLSAGVSNTGSNSICIGLSAGSGNRGSNVIAIGRSVANNNSAQNVINMGVENGFGNTGSDSIFIGRNTGLSNNGQYFLGIGSFVGNNNSGGGVIAIGTTVCVSNGANDVIGIGINSGTGNRGADSIIIGRNTGTGNTGSNVLAFGRDAVVNNSGANIVGFGIQSCQGNTGNNIICITPVAGAFLNRGSNVVALGSYAAYANFGSNVVAIGDNTLTDNSGSNCIAIGNAAGSVNKGSNVYVLGNNAGNRNGGANVHAMGGFSAYQNTGANVHAMGEFSAFQNTGANVVVLGNGAGSVNKGTNVVALGSNAGTNNTGANVIGIGGNACRDNSGANVIGIGGNAARSNTGSNCIFLGANPDFTITNASDHQFIVYSSNNLVPNALRVRLDCNFMGINCNIPRYTLDVNGIANMSSAIVVNNLSIARLNGAAYPQVLGTTGQVLTISSTTNTLSWVHPPSSSFGNVLRVDQSYGSDTLGTPGVYPYLTISKALSIATSGQVVYVMPGTYNESNLTVPQGVVLRGINTQAVTIQQLNATVSTKLISLLTNSRLEDVTLNLTSSSTPTANATYTGLEVHNGAITNSAIRKCIFNLNNYNPSGSITGIVTISNSVNPENITSNSLIRATTINVTTSGQQSGYANCIRVAGANRTNVRDSIMWLNATNCSGSRILAGETVSAGGYLDLHTSILTASGTSLTNCSVGEISRTTGEILLSHTRLNNHSANGLSFSLMETPTNIIYSFFKKNGFANNDLSNKNFYPIFGNNEYASIEDAASNAPSFYVEQDCIMFEPVFSTNTSFGAVAGDIKALIYKNSLTSPLFTLTLSGALSNIQDTSFSHSLVRGDRIFVSLSCSIAGTPPQRNFQVNYGLF